MTQALTSLARLTLRQLRQMASDLGVTLYSRKSKQDLVSAISYGTDRVGFLFAGELAPAVSAIKSAAGRAHAHSARLAIKELVLFSISVEYFALRRELGLVVRKSDAERALRL